MAPRSAGPMILAEGLHKRYGQVHALRGLDLTRTSPLDALLWLHEQQKKLR